LCRRCGRSFSSHTQRATFGQHRPDINRAVYELYASGMTQRRMALVLRVNRKTIVRKFLFVAQLARQAHGEFSQSDFAVAQVQFDEMQTFEHTKLKPVAIALSVDAPTGMIVDAKAASMPYTGPWAGLARQKYGPRRNDTRKAMVQVLFSTRQFTSGGPVSITSDANPKYPRPIKALLPNATHMAVVSRYEKTDRKNYRDPLFTLNYTAAKLRNDLSRLSRKTWVTTKKIERLQKHLDLYLAYNNMYSLPL
jgi:hypothetical protein